MRKVLGGLIALGLLLIVGWVLTRWLAVRRANGALVDEVLAAWNASEPRSGTTHENGYACAAQVLDEKVDLKVLKMADYARLEKTPPEGYSPEFLKVQPWAERLRGCADARALRIVPGVVPNAAWPAAEKSSFGSHSLTMITGVEVKAALAAQDAEKAARLCLGTLEVEADRSFLGFHEALGVGLAVERLAPPCAQALQRLTPEVRAELAPRFLALSSRFLSNGRAYEREWVFRSASNRHGLMSDEQRARLPPELAPRRPESFLGNLALAGSWASQDAAVRKFIAVADTPGSARSAAADEVEKAMRYGLPLGRYHGELSLSEQCDALDTTRELLGVLGKLAAAEDPGTPSRMTRTAEGLEFRTADRGRGFVTLVH